jgi:hypothetical protein
VIIDQPANITNFTGVTIGDDFYFIGKVTAPATTFKVKYKVVLKDPIKCKLNKPNPAMAEKTTAGGLVTPYEVQFKVGGEKKMGGNIYFLPIEIKVNETAKQGDDFVAVSKGTDEDLATDFSVKLTGTDGVTAELSVKAGDGDIKFKDTELALESGKEEKTKLWGITHSSAKDKTIIEVTLTKDYKELGKIEEDETVFEGINIEIKGTMSHATNAIPEGWRPSPWANDPSENPIVPTSPLELAAGKQDSSDISGALSFTTGDHDNHTPRSWARSVKTTIAKVSTQKPPMVELDDFLVDSEIHAKEGVMVGAGFAKDVVNIGPEVWVNAEIIIASTVSPGDSYFSMKMETGTKGDLIDVDVSKPAKRTPEYFDNLNETNNNSPVAGDFWKWFSTDPAAGVDWASDVSGFEATLECNTFEVSKGSLIKKSVAAKGFIAATEEKGKMAKWKTKLDDFNIWWLRGAVEGTITTP